MKKTCTKCKEEKMLTDFVRHSGYKSGYYSQCKTCTYALEKAWRQSNQYKKNVIRTRYRENNREEIRIQDQEMYGKDPEKHRERMKKAMEKYLQCKGRETKEEFKINNPLKVQARLIYRSALRSGKIKKESECTMCGNSNKRIEGHHYDYEKPLEVIWLCCTCHRAMHRISPIHVERLSEKTYYRNEDGTYPPLDAVIGSDSPN